MEEEIEYIDKLISQKYKTQRWDKEAEINKEIGILESIKHSLEHYQEKIKTK